MTALQETPPRIAILIAHPSPNKTRDDLDASLDELERLVTGGGGGRGERGHTNVELAKQALRERKIELGREIGRLRETHRRQIERRRSVPRVALVGYTNAGKSSLLRAMTGAEVHIEDALFATLDPTVRVLSPETRPRILVSDTVGFVRDLPHALVASFHSTLDEAREADLLLLVLDASDPHWPEHLQVTESTLCAVGIQGARRIVLNKIDRLDQDARAALSRELPDAIMVSAHDDAEVQRLRAAVVSHFLRDDAADILVVPFDQPRLLAEIRAHAHVLDEHYDAQGAVLRVRARPEALARWNEALPPRPWLRTPTEIVNAAGRYGWVFEPDPVGLDTQGLDFLVLHAQDEHGAPWILRAPRRSDVAQAAQREARILLCVRPRLPVAVPHWRLHARDIMAYPKLEGQPAWTFDALGHLSWAIDPQAPPEPFLEGYAQVLAALQAVPEHPAQQAAIPVQTIDAVRTELREAMEQTRELLAPPEPVWTRWQQWLEDERGWPPHVALVHGDLHPGHLLLDPRGAIIGILDWTEAKVTDPSVDLAPFLGCFGKAACNDLLSRLARAGGITWPRMLEHTIERWAAYPALVAAWGLRTNSDTALAHARRLLEEVTAETSDRPG